MAATSKAVPRSKPVATTRREKEDVLHVDYRSPVLPSWVREAVEAHLAIESEDAKSAGALGFMARALVIATMPYKDPKVDAFTRVNGDFKLRILAGYEGGIPFGIYPRFLLSWVATEAVQKGSRTIELGGSLSAFLREALDLGRSGGERGVSTRVTEQMKRLFGSLITARYAGNTATGKRSFALENVLIADRFSLDDQDAQRLDGSDSSLWLPQSIEQAGKWQSHVTLSQNFFNECISNPVPIDMRAYKALRSAPLAMDLYTWLTYRLKYTKRQTRPILWEQLMGQFGSSYGTGEDISKVAQAQAVRDFKKNFIRAMKMVKAIYHTANVSIEDNGLVLMPSRPHVAEIAGPRKAIQTNLF